MIVLRQELGILLRARHLLRETLIDDRLIDPLFDRDANVLLVIDLLQQMNVAFRVGIQTDDELPQLLVDIDGVLTREGKSFGRSTDCIQCVGMNFEDQP